MYCFQLSTALGVPCEVLEPSAVLDYHPLLSVSHLRGAVYSGLAGTVEPSGLTAAYSKAATKNGATVRTSFLLLLLILL